MLTLKMLQVQLLDSCLHTYLCLIIISYFVHLSLIEVVECDESLLRACTAAVK